jgi:tripartite ATP-independent transporter DctP family solute receptor
MKKIILSILVGLLSASVCVSYSYASEKPIVLRFADTAGPGMTPYEGNLYFADLVKKRTGGKVVVEYYHSSQLGSDKVITKATVGGSLDMAHSSAGNFSEFSKALFFAELPGIFKNLKHLQDVINSPIRAKISEQIEKETGLTVVMFNGDSGWPRELFNNKRPVRVPDDAKGLKMRTTGSPVEVALFKSWGTSAIPIAWSECYTALQQGVVDGHYVPPMYAVLSKLHEVSAYITFISQSWNLAIEFLGPSAVKKLGPENLKIVLEAGREAEAYKYELCKDANEKAFKEMEKVGCKLIRITEKERKPWFEKSKSIWPNFIGSSKPVSEDLVKEIQALAE